MLCYPIGFGFPVGYHVKSKLGYSIWSSNS